MLDPFKIFLSYFEKKLLFIKTSIRNSMKFHKLVIWCKICRREFSQKRYIKTLLQFNSHIGIRCVKSPADDASRMQKNQIAEDQLGQVFGKAHQKEGAKKL